MFVAIVRQVGPVQQQKFKKGKFNKSLYCNISAQVRTEGVKRQEMKLKGPKKEFISVQEREQQIIDEYQQNIVRISRNWSENSGMYFRRPCQRGVPQKKT